MESKSCMFIIQNDPSTIEDFDIPEMLSVHSPEA